MPTFTVTLADGRTTNSIAPDEAGAKSQAEHWDRTRFIIAVKRGQDPGASPSFPVSVVKVKD